MGDLAPAHSLVDCLIDPSIHGHPSIHPLIYPSTLHFLLVNIIAFTPIIIQ